LKKAEAEAERKKKTSASSPNRRRDLEIVTFISYIDHFVMYPPPPPPPTNNIGDRVHVPLAVTVKGPLVDAKNISEYDDPSPAPITLQEPLQQQKDTSTTASSWIRPSLSKPWFPPPPQPPLAYTTSVRVHEPQEQQQVLTSHPVTQVVHEIEPRPALYSSSSAAAATAAAVATVPCLPPAPMPMHHLYTPMGRSLNSGMKPPPYMYTATAARPATTTIAPPPIMQYSTMAAKHTFPPPPPPPTTTHSTIPTLTSLYSVPPIAPPSSLTAASSQSPHQDRHHQHHPHSVPHVPLFTRTIHSYPDLYCNTIPVYFPRKALEMWKMNHMNNKTHVSSSTSYSSSPVSTHILHPPPEDSRYLVQDDGNASPRVLTCNMMIIPQNSYLLQKTMGGTTCSTTSSHGDTKTHVFGLICQPLAIPSMDFITHDYSITSKTINHDSITKVEIHNEMESNVHNIRHENNKGEKQDDTVDDDWELLPDLEKVPLISTWYNSTFHRSTTTTPHHPPTLKSLQPVTPLRCTFCQAYVNPFCTVSYSTHKETCTITCPFCSTQTTVSLDTYLVSTSSTYDLQQQQQQQPILPQLDSVVSSITHTTALQFGTVEYEVGGPYITRHVDSFSSSSYEVVPNMDSIAPPLVYLYAIDISFCSYPSTRTDMYTHLLQGYLDALRFVAQEMAICWCKQQQDVLTLGLPPRVGFILYDDQGQVIIPYWTLNKIRSTGASEWKVQVALMCDVCKDPFAPLPLSEWTYYTMDCQQSCTPVEKDNNDKKKHSILFNNSMNGYKEMLQQIPTILKQLSPKLGEGKTTSSNMNFTGSALSVLVHALESNTMDSTGGRITILTSSRPNTGVGALSDLETSSTSDRGIVGGSSTTTIKYSRMETERILYTSLLKLVEGKIPFTKTPMDDQAYSFYSQLIRVCQKSNTSIDICMTTPRVMGRNFLGLATLGDVCQRTCGALKWLSYIDTADIQGSWKHQLQSELLYVKRNAIHYCLLSKSAHSSHAYFLYRLKGDLRWCIQAMTQYLNSVVRMACMLRNFYRTIIYVLVPLSIPPSLNLPESTQILASPSSWIMILEVYPSPGLARPTRSHTFNLHYYTQP